MVASGNRRYSAGISRHRFPGLSDEGPDPTPAGAVSPVIKMWRSTARTPQRSQARGDPFAGPAAPPIPAQDHAGGGEALLADQDLAQDVVVLEAALPQLQDARLADRARRQRAERRSADRPRRARGGELDHGRQVDA